MGAAMENQLQNEDSNEARKAEKSSIDFDVVLKYLGPCGRYQFWLVILLYYLALPCGMHQVAAVFISAIPAFRCWVPGVDDNMKYVNVSMNDILNVTTPYANEKYDTCLRYNYTPSNCSDGIFDCFKQRNTTQASSCEGYVYDTMVDERTVATEWDLVCDRAIFGTTATAIFYSGVLFGAIVGGSIADSIGRVPTMVVAQMGMVAAGVACAFSDNIYVFSVLRFIVGSLVMASAVSAFVYLMEITAGKWKTIIGIAFQGAFAIGYMLLSGLAVRWMNWRELQIAISLVSLPSILYWLIPESPRWVFSKGRYSAAMAATHKIAKINKVNLSQKIWDLASVKKSEEEQKRYTPLILFRMPAMRVVTLNVAFSWFVISLVYYGLSLNVGNLVGSKYINNVLSGLMDLASLPIVMFTMEKYGRRKTMNGTLLLGGISCIGATVAKAFAKNQPELDIVASVLALSGKLAISGSFNVLYNFTAELYPTVVRSTAVGLGSMSARIGSICSPYTLYLQNSVPWLTGTIFGVLSVVAGLLSLSLPETKGAPMLTSLAEAEAFYRRSKYLGKMTGSSFKNSARDDVKENEMMLISSKATSVSTACE